MKIFVRILEFNISLLGLNVFLVLIILVLVILKSKEEIIGMYFNIFILKLVKGKLFKRCKNGDWEGRKKDRYVLKGKLKNKSFKKFRKFKKKFLNGERMLLLEEKKESLENFIK